MENQERINSEKTITDMELMQKMMRFMRKTRMEMGGRGVPGMGRPGMGMPLVPPMPPHGYVKREHRMELCGEDRRDTCKPPMPLFENGMFDRKPPMPPFGPGMHGRKPPLSREHLLVLIGRHPDGIRQKNLCEMAGINQSSVSELVDKLEGDGYIRREIDPSDRRATLLFLTELGQARAAEVEDERQEMFRGIFDRLTAEEKQTLAGLLDKLNEQ